MRVLIKRSWSRVLGFIVITALVPLPALAGDPTSAERPPSIKEAAKHIVARDVSAQPARSYPAREARQASTPTNSTSFFKTRPGMIALAVIAVGTGYAIYSAQHDRIRSPGRN